MAFHDFIFSMIEYSLLTGVSVLAIILFSKTFDLAWFLLALAVLSQYLDAIYSLLVKIGIISLNSIEPFSYASLISSLLPLLSPALLFASLLLFVLRTKNF